MGSSFRHLPAGRRTAYLRTHKNIKSFNPAVIAFKTWGELIKAANRCSSWKDRVRYFFAAPGWSHDGSTFTTRQLRKGIVATIADKQPASLAEAEKPAK